MKTRKTFSSRLTARYLLIVRNEEDFAEKSTFTFTYAKLSLFVITACILMLVISLFLVNTLLKQWFDPRYVQAEADRKLVALSLAVDSLEQQVQKEKVFITSFQGIVMGEPTQDNESYYLTHANSRSGDGRSQGGRHSGDKHQEGQGKVSEALAVDAQFRQEFEEEEVETLNVSNGAAPSLLDELFFFAPISGIISAPYSTRTNHYGVDVVSKKNEPIKNVADGTVIMASWTQDAGYVVAVQHRSNVISIYKHNSSLLKKEGEFVNAGDVIAIIGDTGELTSGPHLHFELWYNGNPVDPEEFISF